MSFGPHNLIARGMHDREVKNLLGQVSNEAEDTSGRTSAEIERVLYARVPNFDFLERASGADRQEQWSIKIEKTEENAGSGSIRVRKSINLREPGAAVSYVLTTKLDIGKKGSSAETPEQSSLDQFNIFKYLANKGMIKDRYYFPIEGSDLMYEVDCFPKEGEMYHPWIKIDLEKWPRGKELPQLPFDFAELIDGSEGMQSEESKAKISELYETIFLTKNTNTPLADYGEDPANGPTDEEGQAKANDPGTSDPDQPNPDDQQKQQDQQDQDNPDDAGGKKPEDDQNNGNPDDNKDQNGQQGNDDQSQQ